MSAGYEVELRPYRRGGGGGGGGRPPPHPPFLLGLWRSRTGGGCVCSEWNEGVAFMSQEAPSLPRLALITSCIWPLLLTCRNHGD